MNKTISPTEAEFWLDTDRYANYIQQNLEDNSETLLFSIDMVRLSSIRKAVSNFVRILTRKNIPVYFKETGDSFNVGGETIYISATITSRQDFDVVVGQALHEAAHTLLTDFDMVKIAWTNIPHHLLQKSDSKNIRRASFEKFLHGIWNVIEDRYIDNYVFNNAPGYRGYYAALYARFWNCFEIDEYLLGDDFRFPSLKSYDFRITNFTNENTDLLALPRLDDIADVIDIAHIDRLKTTKERIQAAFKVTEIVLDCLDKQPIVGQTAQGQGSAGQKGKGMARPEDFFDFGDSESSSEPMESDKSEQSSGEDVDVGKKMVEEIADVLGERDPTPEKLKENEECVKKISECDLGTHKEKQIKQMLERQRQFLTSEFPKESITPQQKKLLDLIEKHGISLVRVDAPTVLSGDDEKLKVDCIVVKEMSKDLILSGDHMFPLCGVMQFGKEMPEPNEKNAEAVRKGISLGTKLGRKLQIRNEVNQVKVVRKKWGKINKRQLYEASFDAEDLFYKINIEEHHKASLHITVDASGSMGSGQKWFRTITAVVAICKATSMVDNVHVTVSFRTTQDCNGSCLPYVILAYDSNVDKFSKVRTLFPYLSPNGATPEGLAFSAIMDLFENITPDEEDRYFLNLSDGQPSYALRVPSTGLVVSYDDNVGTTHTKSQVDKIRRYGVDILSYFIEEDYSPYKKKDIKTMTDKEKEEYKKYMADLEKSPVRKNFRKMYGKNAQFINVESIVDLARTINGLFLTK